jgi:hypothetical protein
LVARPVADTERSPNGTENRIVGLVFITQYIRKKRFIGSIQFPAGFSRERQLRRPKFPIDRFGGKMSAAAMAA